jgi:hypothetical protein
MPDVFISHSSSDTRFAEFLSKHLTSEGLTVFVASISIAPGQRWPQEVLHALEISNWVLFLASRTACASPWVQQEIGAALGKQKKLIPIVWDIPASQLPGWTGQIQAVNLAGASADQVRAQVMSIAGQIKADKAKGLLIAGLLIAGLVVLAAQG